MSGLFDGAEVVLGPDSGLLSPAPEQQFINQKMRPGSGVLSVQVVPDGPTRVLQVRARTCSSLFSKQHYILEQFINAMWLSQWRDTFTFYI